MMVSRRQQLREAANENARLNAENNRLRAALDGAQQEKAEWQRRAERFADDLGVAKADAVRSALGGSGVLADAQRDIERLQAQLSNREAELAEERRKSHDLDRLLRESRSGDGVLPKPADPGVVAHLERELRMAQERCLALQERLDERQRLSEAADARRAPRKLGVAR